MSFPTATITCIPKSQKTDGICVQDNCPPGYCITQLIWTTTTPTIPPTMTTTIPPTRPPIPPTRTTRASSTMTTTSIPPRWMGIRRARIVAAASTTAPTQTSGALSLVIGSLVLVAGLGSIVYELNLYKHPVLSKFMEHFFRLRQR